MTIDEKMPPIADTIPAWPVSQVAGTPPGGTAVQPKIPAEENSAEPVWAVSPPPLLITRVFPGL